MPAKYPTSFQRLYLKMKLNSYLFDGEHGHGHAGISGWWDWDLQENALNTQETISGGRNTRFSLIFVRSSTFNSSGFTVLSYPVHAKYHKPDSLGESGMKTAPLPYVCLFLAGIGLAQAQEVVPCDRTQVKETGATDAMLTLVGTVMSNSLTASCDSLAKVLNEVTSRGETGGKKSKKDKPLDLRKAEGNLQQALSVPDIRSRIDRIRAEVADEGAQLAYEAAILDEAGYEDARELKIRQLQQRLF